MILDWFLDENLTVLKRGESSKNMEKPTVFEGFCCGPLLQIYQDMVANQFLKLAPKKHQVWIQFEVQQWSKFGPKLVQNWFKIGSKMVNGEW